MQPRERNQEMMHPAKIQLNGKPTHLKIGDLNGDGRNDVITVLDRGVKVIHIHYQDESHSLTDTFELALEASEHANVSLALGDMDGNGSNDMLVTNSTSGKVLCYYQDRAIGLELRHILEPEIHPRGGDCGPKLRRCQRCSRLWRDLNPGLLSETRSRRQ